MKLRRSLLIALALLMAFAFPVFAVDPPEQTTIISARGYGDVDETGDILLVVHFDLDYGASTIPTVPASQTSLVQYIDTSATSTSTVIRSTSPRAGSGENGYGQGLVGIYFDAAGASTLNLTHADTDQARIRANPAFPGLTFTTTVDIDWQTKGSQSVLEANIIAQVLALEEQTEWAGTDLIAFDSGRNVLQGAGEDYLENGIPRLRQIAPNLFSAVVRQVTFIEGDFNQSYQTTLEGAWAGSVLEGSFDNLASWVDMPVIALSTTMVLLGSMIAGGMLAALVVSAGVDREPAAGMAFLIAAIIIGLAAFNGIFSLTVLAVMGFMGILLIGATVWLKRS